MGDYYRFLSLKIVPGVRTGISLSKKMGEKVELPPMSSSRRHVNSFNSVSCISEYFKNSFISNVIKGTSTDI